MLARAGIAGIDNLGSPRRRSLLGILLALLLALEISLLRFCFFLSRNLVRTMNHPRFVPAHMHGPSVLLLLATSLPQCNYLNFCQLQVKILTSHSDLIGPLSRTTTTGWLSGSPNDPEIRPRLVIFLSCLATPIYANLARLYPNLQLHIIGYFAAHLERGLISFRREKSFSGPYLRCKLSQKPAAL